MKNKFTTNDIDKLKKALKKAGAKPIKLGKIKGKVGYCVVK